MHIHKLFPLNFSLLSPLFSYVRDGSMVDACCVCISTCIVLSSFSWSLFSACFFSPLHIGRFPQSGFLVPQEFVGHMYSRFFFPQCRVCNFVANSCCLAHTAVLITCWPHEFTCWRNCLSQLGSCFCGWIRDVTCTHGCNFVSLVFWLHFFPHTYPQHGLN